MRITDACDYWWRSRHSHSLYTFSSQHVRNSHFKECFLWVGSRMKIFPLPKYWLQTCQCAPARPRNLYVATATGLALQGLALLSLNFSLEQSSSSLLTLHLHLGHQHYAMCWCQQHSSCDAKDTDFHHQHHHQWSQHDYSPFPITHLCMTSIIAVIYNYPKPIFAKRRFWCSPQK